MSGDQTSGPRCVALVGPYLSGKTTLLESILFATGAIPRKGAVNQGNSVGDSSEEARAREMSTEVNTAQAEYLGDRFVFLDCPGSVEFQQDTRNALLNADAAVIVVEAAMQWPVTAAPIFKLLEEQGTPTIVFVNKIDKATGSLADLVERLAPVSGRPLILRHLPIVEGEEITGYVDLASERAYRYTKDGASEIIELPDGIEALEKENRFTMLESLSDFDDELMEALLEDVTPEKEKIYQDLTQEFREGQIVPVFMGSAESDSGVRRLLKALRHEVPDIGFLAARNGIDLTGGPLAQVIKTYHIPRSGKLSLARVYRGPLKDGETLNAGRVSGVFSLRGSHADKLAGAEAGDTVALGRLDDVHTGDVLVGKGATVPEMPRAKAPMAIFAHAISAENRSDEVKLSGAIAKIVEEDPSLVLNMNEDTHELVLSGQGEVHLRVAGERLNNKYGLTIQTSRPKIPYKEAIRKGITQRGKFKRQTGGHGQYGDVVLEIKPLPRGSGFSFNDKITGGVVPKTYIGSVETGVTEYLAKGPLGFPIVDLSVTLIDGSYHAVDSSDIAFKTAGRIAMSEGMVQCDPVLLEPVVVVEITVPSEYTSKVNQVISTRRGQILGFEPKDGWAGWDVVRGHMPQAETRDLIIELRSLSHGSAYFAWEFDHLIELMGREAEQVLADRKAELEAH